MKRHLIAITVLSTLLAGCGQSTPEEYVLAGQEKVRAGQTSAAVLEFKSALQVDKNNVAARVGLARIDIADRRYGDAENALTRAADSATDPKQTAEINRLLARTYFRNERDRRVLDIPINGDPEIAFYHTMEWLSSNDMDQAQASAGVPTPLSPFVDMANAALIAESDPEKAMALMPTQLKADSPAYGEAQLMTAGLNAAMGNTSAMLEAMGNYYKAEPRDDYRSLQYASVLISEKRSDEAEPIINDMLSRYPQHGLLNQLKAQAAYERQDYDTAINAASLATVDDPTSVTSRLIAAYSETQLNNDQAALGNLEFVIDKLSSSHPAQRLYLHLKAKSGDVSGLRERALAIGEMTPDDAQLLSAIGLEMLRSGRIEDAKALSDKASSLGATGDAASTLGLLKLSLNEDGAFSILETAFDDASATAMAGDNLAGAYLGARRYEDALTLADEWAGKGETVKANMLRGVVHARKGHPHHAVEFFDAVLAESPKHSLARASLIESLVSLEQDELVRQKVGAWLVEDKDLYLLRHYTSAMRFRGALEAAIVELEKWVDLRFAHSTQAQVMVAQAAFLAGEPSITLERLNRISDGAFMGSTDYWLLKSASHERLGDITALADTYRAWMDEAESNPAPLMGMLRILANQADFLGAVELIKERLPYLEEKAPANLMRTHFLIQGGDWRRARAVFASLPRNIKETRVAIGIAGALDFEQARHESAAEKLDTLFSGQADEVYMQYWMGAYRALGKVEEGYQKLADYLAKYPSSALGWFAVGNHYAGKTQYAMAEEAYRRALEVRANVLLSNNLAYVLLKQNKLTDAFEVANAAFVKRPDFMALADTLANVLLAQGKAGEAEAVLSPFATQAQQGKVKLSDAFIETRQRVKAALGK